MKIYPWLMIFLAICHAGITQPFNTKNPIINQDSITEFKRTLSANHIWNTAYYNGLEQTTIYQRLKVDTTHNSISNQIYQQVLSSPDSSGNNWITTHKYVREADGKLWLIDSTYNPKVKCIMDMSLSKGDEFSIMNDVSGMMQTFRVFAIDSMIDMDRQIRKVIHLSCESDPFARYQWIEGIGPEVGVFSSSFLQCMLDGPESILTCFHDDNFQIWQSEYFQNCWQPSTIDTTDMHSSTTWYSSSYVGNFADGDCRKKIDITKVVRDTIIGDRLCRIIDVFTGGRYLPESEIITFMKEKRVFFYEDNVWKLLYDFNRQVGDTLTYFISKKYRYYEKLSVPSSFEQDIIDGNPYRLVINSVDTTYDFTGKPIRRFHTNNLIKTSGHSMGVIMENVGSINKFFGSNIINAGPECIEFDILGLRCYSDDDNFLKFVSGKCDELTSVNFESYDDKVIIYPNPGGDKMTIKMPYDVVLPLHYQIKDVSGRVIVLGSHNQSQWVQSTEHLMPGWYFISILDAKGRQWVNKWVKE